MSSHCLHSLSEVPDLLDVMSSQPHYRFLLDSAATGPLGQYSLLLRAEDEHISLDTLDESQAEPFLSRLSDWYEKEKIEQHSSVTQLPFCGGWFVYFSYELAGEIEPVLNLPEAPESLPVALAVRCRGAVIVEHGDKPKAFLVAEDQPLIEVMKAELADIQESTAEPVAPDTVDLHPDSDERFTRSVERIKRYLKDGDVFQVNLSRDWNGSFDAKPDVLTLYRSLKSHNPAPFAGLMSWNDATLLSSSPERLVEVRDNLVQTRPIAGTYPRSTDRAADDALSRDLLAHPKERAEHIMLIDLERNDLGRVCSTGSVEVSELMVVESYTHVHHIVSNVRGHKRDDVGPAEVIAAVFPGGTITGCPKVRCMQIIAELEQRGRGYYTGSMGYISRDGQMDLNILIRSMVVEGTSISLRTGAGIVTDSVAQRELAETRAKARGLLMALGSTDD